MSRKEEISQKVHGKNLNPIKILCHLIELTIEKEGYELKIVPTEKDGKPRIEW